MKKACKSAQDPKRSKNLSMNSLPRTQSSDAISGLKRLTRVLVVGLDAATLEIIKPMARNGKLPNFGRLMREGSFGALKSSMPPITPCAWTSFATGKDPSKHGLYDFDLHEGNPEKTKRVNRTFVRAKSLWKILSEAGKRSIVIDVPLTYPPEVINGILISRVDAPQKKNCTYPKSLYYTLRRRGFIAKIDRSITKEHGADKANKEEAKKKLGRISKARMRKIARLRTEEAFQNIVKEIDKNIELAKQFMEKEDWDFFMMAFMSADYAGHSFWQDQVKVKKIYEKLDEAVGTLFRIAGEDAVKFIISDHGFTSLLYSFNINEWLHEKGFLEKKIDIPWKESIKELKQFLRKFEGKKTGGLAGDNKLSKFRYLLRTDYAKSKAYFQSWTSYGIRINLEGRDTTGIVKREDYQSFRRYLISELKKIKHPSTGRRVFSDVLKKEEVYSESPLGINPAPDIFLVAPEINLEGRFQQNPHVFGRTPRGYGFHHIDGIFFASGKGIRKRCVCGTRITDLAPTILHILGVPVPEDIDGRVLRQIFDSGSQYADRQVAYQGPSAIAKEERVYSKKDETKIKKRLEALGYIE